MSATSFAVIDEAGAELDISHLSDKGVTAARRQPLYELSSNPLVVSDNAAAMVFYNAFDSRLITLPVRLKAGELTLIRP